MDVGRDFDFKVWEDIKYDKHVLLKMRATTTTKTTTTNLTDKHIFRVLSESKIKRFLIASVNKFNKLKDKNTLNMLSDTVEYKSKCTKKTTYNAKFKNKTYNKRAYWNKDHLKDIDLHRWPVGEGSCWAPVSCIFCSLGAGLPWAFS